MMSRSSPSAVLTTAASAAFAVGLLFPGVSEGHVCLLSPQQRGAGVPSNLGPGDPLCYHRTPYCGGQAVPAGGVPANQSQTNSFLAGSTAQLLFQQNLNHFWAQDPGSLDVAVSYDLDPAEDSWTVLKTFNDFPANDMVTQTNFTAEVTIPNKAAEHALLRFRYVSHNPGEIDPANNTESIFYNCADIRIVANPSLAAADDSMMADKPEQIKAAQLTAPVNETGCVVPPKMAASALEHTVRGLVHHRLIYDNERQLMRWDREGYLHERGVFETLSTYTFYNETIPGQPNYTKPEYLVTEKGAKCVLYGADPSYQWEFGPNRGQKFLQEYYVPTFEGHDYIQEWATQDLEHRYVVNKMRQTEFCIPVSEQHPHSTLDYVGVEVGHDVIPEDAFDLPSSCKKPIYGHGLEM